MLRFDSGAANVRVVTIRVPVPGEHWNFILPNSLTYLFFGQLQEYKESSDVGATSNPRDTAVSFANP
jgi:hypothetical protein